MPLGSLDLFSGLLGMAEARRRHSRHAAKGACKIILVLKTQIEAHVQYAEAGVPQKLAGPENAPLQNIPVRAESRASLKLCRKIEDAQLCILSERGQTDVFIQMRVDKRQYAFQAR